MFKLTIKSIRCYENHHEVRWWICSDLDTANCLQIEKYPLHCLVSKEPVHLALKVGPQLYLFQRLANFLCRFCSMFMTKVINICWPPPVRGVLLDVCYLFKVQHQTSPPLLRTVTRSNGPRSFRIQPSGLFFFHIRRKK